MFKGAGLASAALSIATLSSATAALAEEPRPASVADPARTAEQACPPNLICLTLDELRALITQQVAASHVADLTAQPLVKSALEKAQRVNQKNEANAQR